MQGQHMRYRYSFKDRALDRANLVKVEFERNL